MEEIILWESQEERILACDLAVNAALQELGLKKSILINAEPPLISRSVNLSRLPVLEIRGQQWSLKPGQPFTKDQLITLFRKVFIEI